MLLAGYRVGWEYAYKELPKSKTLVEFTSCTVVKDTVTLRGQTFRSPHDDLNKENGKKEALKRAIATLPRETRIAIWEAYRTMTKIPKWSPRKSRNNGQEKTKDTTRRNAG